MAIQWATMDVFCYDELQVIYGTSETNLNQVVESTCYPFDVGGKQLKQSNYLAYMTNLQASTKYYYRISDGNVLSDILYFTTAPDAITILDDLPQRFIIYGDLGQDPDDSSTVMPWTSLEVQSGNVDMILHLGDFAYDFNSKLGKLLKLGLKGIDYGLIS